MRLLVRLWKWFDDITGISAALGPLISHPVPRARKSAWFYVLGSATLVAFLIQIVTGIALASGYVPSSGQAYDSLVFITGTHFGRVVRGIHAFGADAMIILIGLHAIRVYLMAAYKYPRQMNWLTGAGLLLLTLLMAFTGQLLRWDQTGFWSVVIAAEQAGRTPFIGNWLGHFILAGDTVQGATLSRFFAAHVFFIPALIFLFVGFHLYLVMHNGISEPPKAGRPVDPRTYRAWYHTLVTKDGQPFWPDAAWRDVVFGLLVVIAVVALAIAVGPPELGRPPDPTIVQASPRPEWYFLWYYALLSIIPRWSEDWVIILGPAIFGAVLILLPLLAPKGERSPLRRPWSLVIVAFTVFMISYYGHMGHVAPWSPRMEAEPLPAAVVGTTAARTSRLLIRSASNAYFPQLMSVISLPERDEIVRRAVDAAWSYLEIVEDLDQLRYERQRAAVKSALEGISDEEAFADIQARRGGGAKPDKSVKVAELETLVTAKEEIGEDRPEGVFYARLLPRSAWDRPWMAPIERVVLVHRLREVVAQVGFTRFESAAPDIEGELDMGVRRASLAREITWLPAFENKGEGVFLQFKTEAMQSWFARPAVQKRGIQLGAGFEAWRAEHQGTSRQFPGLAYLMLHSFSHLLITAVALGCGYPASSIRERIYAIPNVGYGVLLYTGTSDAEGTLGGLVQVGRRIYESVRSALDLGELCSNDPVCAQHEASSDHERRFLHGSACHGCVLISETSCEQQNDFLDRALVVRTVQNCGAEFFVQSATANGQSDSLSTAV